MTMNFAAIGIGAIPDAVLACLTNHKNLGVHSEMFSDGVVDLVEKGCITNHLKELMPGKIVTAFLAGSKRLFDFVDHNPFVCGCSKATKYRSSPCGQS